MEHCLRLLLISASIMGITAIKLQEDDDIFICRKHVFIFGQPSGAMNRNSSFVLSTDDTLAKIKIQFPLIKMHLEVSGATFTICDTSIPTVDIVAYDTKDKGHFRVTRQGGSQAFGTIAVNFKPRKVGPSPLDYDEWMTKN